MSLELKVFGSSLEGLQANWANLEQQVKTIQQTNTTLTARVSELAETNRTLLEENSRITTRNDALEKSVIDLTQELKTKKNQEEEEVHSLKQQLAKYKAMAAQVEKAITSLKTEGEAQVAPVASVQAPKKLSPKNTVDDPKMKLAELEAKHKAAPEDPQILFDLAKANFDGKDNKKALELFKKVEGTIQSEKWLLSHYIARTAARLNDLEFAFNYAERAINEEPTKKKSQTYITLADIAIKLKRIAKASWAISEAKRCNADVKLLETELAKLTAK